MERKKKDEFAVGYSAAIADLFRLDGGSSVRAGELLRTVGGVKSVKGVGVCSADMHILRRIEREEGE